MYNWSTLKKLIWLYAAKIRGGASAIIETITGTLPLVLQNAISHAIVSLTRYGKCEQDGIPTPSSPVDIVCNNGALRYGAIGSNLLDPSAANVMLGYYINKADGEIKPSPANFIFAKYMPVEPGKTYVAYGRAKLGGDLSDYNRIAWYDSNKTWLMGADYIQNRIAVVTAPANAAYARFSVNPSGSSATIVTQEIVDSYNWMFAEGTTEIVPFVPFVGGIYTDGTPETLTVRGANVIDTSMARDTMGLDYWQAHKNEMHYGCANCNTWSVGANITTGSNYWNGSARTMYLPCKAGDVFRVKGYDGYSTSSRQWVAFVDANNIILVKGAWTDTGSYTAPSGAVYAFIEWAVNDENIDGWLVTKNTALPATYQPFVQPQTVTDIPMLLSVGDYKDEAELISGIKTGKVGVKVFDGTENWTAYTSSTLVIQNATSDWGAVAGVGGYCTHLTVLKAGETTFAGSCRFATAFNLYEYKTAFGVADVAGFKAKLAEQYAAGTPVILLYPLATETTEHITAQHLDTHQGTNIVDSVANVGPLEAKVEYYASANAALSALLGVQTNVAPKDAQLMLNTLLNGE